jgi:hypothetical protein
LLLLSGNTVAPLFPAVSVRVHWTSNHFSTMKCAADLLDCTICFQLSDEKIYQCFEGHLVCAICMEALWRQNAQACPTCRGKLPDKKECIRSRLAEALISSSKSVCEHCRLEMSRADLRQHHLHCPENKGRCVFLRFDDRVEHYESFKGEERMMCIAYNAQHVCAGEIWHYEAETHVRTTFQDDHARKSEVQHFEDNQLARKTFLDSRRNLVEHYVDGELVRKTFKGGAYSGTVEHFAAGLHTKRTFESGPHIGRVLYFNYTTAQDVPGGENRREVALASGSL